METTTLDFLGDLRRTHHCGELRPFHNGERALLMGWVHRRRDLGGVIFIHLRDREGVTQVLFRQDAFPEVLRKAENLGLEYVIAVEGVVESRSADTINPSIPTGEVEILCDKLWILNESRTPPFPMEDAVDVKEETRLKYRYVDLRRPRMQRNIILRANVALAIRRALYAEGFLEIETPFLTKSTPEGSRDFLVPSRMQPGSFYALPQSPQIFKQILMVSGFDKYFQIVRCFRDEDLRADRQPEFTQIDLEMSFPQEQAVFRAVEAFVKAAFEAAGFGIETPFPTMTYADAMNAYGSDKPELRLPRFYRVEHLFDGTDFPKGAMPVAAFVIPKTGLLSRKERDDLKAFGQERGLRVFDDPKRLDRDYGAAMVKVRELVQPGDEDSLMLAGWAGEPSGPKPEETALKACGQFRLHAGQKYNDRHKLLDPAVFKFTWVTEFPMFEWNEEDKKWDAAHHPFCSVLDSDLEKLTSDPATCRARSYDVVLNGNELGSGSIRIHRRDIQAQVFAALGLTKEEAQKKFGFLLEALEYGAPPHGGIALGLDRLIMILCGETSLREVIPFPKTAKGTDLMCEAPSEVADRQLRELGIKLR
jgi:aspartyl-tRNA synthetase